MMKLPLRPLKSHASEESIALVWRRIERTRARKTRSKQAAKILIPIAAMLLLFVMFDREEIAPREEPSGSTLRLSERSEVRVEEGARLRVAGQTADRVRLVLERGRVDFDVDPAEERRWSIDCGLVMVEVVGTRFTIVRSEDEVEVAVERGIVRVTNDRIDRLLIAGERFEIEDAPRAAEEARASEEERAEATPRIRSRRAAKKVPAPGESPADAALDPALEPAIDLPKAPEPTVDELLDRADRARVEGKRSDAIAILRALIRDRAGDPRAGIACFTLGRLLAEEAAHAEAAAAFERALELGVPHALIEGAMSRAFEAHDAAGDRANARKAAQRYFDRFPNGRQAALAREVLAR